MTGTIHSKIVKELIEQYSKDPSTVAITLFGSVAEGRERPDSDIDIEIISSKAKDWQLITESRYGIRIDMEICPKDRLLERVNKYPFISHIFLKQKIVYDPGGFMQAIIDKLKKYFAEHEEVRLFWENNYKLMKIAKSKGHTLEDPMKVYDEAEIKFSPEHKVTRDFFRIFR